MLPFKKAVNAEMRRLALVPNLFFYGQSLRYDGAAIYDSLDGIPMARRVEMPVAEDFQLGYCIGQALTGILPVCIFPRMDFMLLCVNQLVNHLDKLPVFGWTPKMILRTTVGHKTPLNAGPQHTQNHTAAFRKMLTSVLVIEVHDAREVELAYRIAMQKTTSTLIVENPL